VDLTLLPFSRYGSYLSVLTREDALAVRNAHDNQETDLLTIRLQAGGAPVAFTVEHVPGALTLSSPQGQARVWLLGDWGLVVDAAAGLDVQVSPQLGLYGFGYQRRPGEFTLQPALNQVVTRVDVPRGKAAIATRWPAPHGYLHCDQADVLARDDGDGVRVVLRMSEDDELAPLPELDADLEIDATRQAWDAFLATMPAVPAEHRSTAQVAWYTLWMSTVRARGLFAHDAVLMAKTKMFQVWSWDHCFTALALAGAQPELAWQQFRLPFERQLPGGRLPDSISDTRLVTTFTKPPVHGWCLSRLLPQLDLPLAELRRTCADLARWTDWWLTERDFDGDGLPAYVHSNDSGWDNNTLADAGVPIQAPDLAAYLVLQLSALADLHERLGDAAEASVRRLQAQALQDRLLEQLWTPTGFVARAVGSHQSDPNPTSLLVLMPLVLGDRLPAEQREILVDRLEREFLTAGGPATEALASPRHVAEGEGYGMRGPVWPSITYLLVDGLARAGCDVLARRIATGFCAMVRRTGAMYENYEARSGAGRNVPGYTWTAAVYLLLLTEHLTGDLPEERAVER